MPAGAASGGPPGALQASAPTAAAAAPPASSVRAGGTGAGAAYFPVLVCALPGLDVLDGPEVVGGRGRGAVVAVVLRVRREGAGRGAHGR